MLIKSKKILQLSILATSLLLFNNSNAACIKDLKLGVQYNKLSEPSRKIEFNNTQGKPEVIEFFWYGCGHCYHMDKMVSDFANEHAKDIVFKRYPVMFPRWESGAQLFFTLEQMHLLDKLHTKVFDKIHKDKVNIMNDKAARDDFLKSQGVDVVKFNEIYNSFGIKNKMNIAKEYTNTYQLNSSPSFVVNHKYTVDPALANSYEGTIKNLNLIVNALNDKTCK